MDELFAFLSDHLAWCAAAIVFAALGQIAKNAIWTRERAAKHWAFRLARKTLPQHPVIAGLLLGLVPGVPAPGFDGPIARCLYYGAAGFCSVWVYAVIRSWIKGRLGRDVELPGESGPPSA